MSRIHIYNAFSIHDVLRVLEDIREKLEDGNDPFYSNVKLLVLDNCASVIYPIQGGSSMSDSKLIHVVILHCCSSKIAVMVFIDKVLLPSKWVFTYTPHNQFFVTIMTLLAFV